jgi:predicted Zn-dependent peptidase
MARVLVGCRLPARDRSHDAAIDLATFLVQQGVSQTLRDQGDLYGVWATAGETGTHATVLLLGAEVAPTDGGAALAALTGVLDLVTGGVSERELAWARTAVKLRFARDTNTAWSSLILSADAAMDGLSVDDLRAYPRRVDAADAAAVTAVLADCVGHTIGTYLGPRTELPGVPWEDGSELHAAIVAGL